MNKLYKTMIFVALCLINTSFCKRPSIILVHGLLNNAQDIMVTAEKIKEIAPDAYVKIINLGFGKWTSFLNIFDQAEWLKIELNNDPNVGNDCILFGYSQAGLVARYYAQRYNVPKVKKLITFGTPHQGIFGSPGFLDSRFSWIDILELYAYKIFYLYPIQKYISVASYWKDPLHHEEYINKCLFLPHANNEIEHIYNETYKEHIESLEAFVLVNSTAEDIITPSISCHFGFYLTGSNRHTQPFLDSEQYQHNLLGLKTLYDQGKLIFKTTTCTHMEYVSDEQNFRENIVPYLT